MGRIKHNPLTSIFIGITIAVSAGFVKPNLSRYYSLPPTNGFVSDQIVVRFSSEIANNTKRKIIRQNDAKTITEIPDIGATVLQVPDENVQAAIDNLLQQQGVIYAEPNYLAEATDVIPNDPGWGNQYNLAAIRAPAGWQLNTGAVWVTIAIIDSGVDLTHPDLFVRILPGYDFVNNDNDPQDDNGHGTHVAAIAAASSNNAVGISGVNWGASILPVKVLNASGNGTYTNVAAGIVWATNHGAQVINLSLGGASPSFVLSDAVDYAYTHGVTLVASTGNAGAPAVLYPAAFDAIIAVGATDISNSWASFSNYGPEVDVVAPGANIYSAYPGGGYGYRSGTSMSAPHVSGLAAILWGIPGNGPAKIRTIIESTSQDLGNPGWDEFFGNGLIQMDAAILNALPIPTVTPTDVQSAQEEPQAYISPSQIYIPYFTATFPPTLLSTATNTPLASYPTLPPEFIEGNAIVFTPTQTNQTAIIDNGKDTSWMGCLGIFLTLSGVLLFWFGVRKRRIRLKRMSLWGM